MSITNNDEQIDKLVKNYKYYQDKLLQVTQKNRSVLLKKIYHKHNFDLNLIENLKPGTIEKIVINTIKNIEMTLNDKKDDGLSQNILLDSLENNDADSIRSRLKTLSRNLTQIEEETGQQTGYFGFPFLQGHLNSSFYIRGPLILFPISIEHRRKAKNGGWFIHFANKRPIINGSLIAALKKKGGYEIMENYEEQFDNMIENISMAKVENPEEYFFEKVNDWIKTIIPIKDTKNQLQTLTLESLSRSDIEILENEPMHLINYKIIGNFPQADNEIYDDYNKLIQNVNLFDNGIIGDLIGIKNSDTELLDFDGIRDEIDNVSDKELNLVLESDSSQDEVILESKTSNLTVVRGPPGTGKSQVIVNLISDALTNNKKILVVCQKRAALEVVKQRLGQVDLDRYVVFLEKELDDRIKMYQQLHKIIEEMPYQNQYSESYVDEISNKIDVCIKYLSSLGKALRKEYFGGVTAHKIYSKANGNYNPILDLSKIDFNIKWRDFDDYIQKIKNLEDIFKKLENDDHFWFGRNSFADFGIMQKNKLNTQLQDLIDLSSTCMLAKNSTDQSNLESLFNIYLNDPGFLKMRRRKSAKKIKEILKITKIDENFVSENFNKIKLGLDFWRIFSILLQNFNDEKQKKLWLLLSDIESLKLYLSDMKNSLEDFDIMQELDKKKLEYEKSIFSILTQMKSRVDVDVDDNWSERIKQEIYIYWLAKIEHEYPILKGDPISNYQINKNNLSELMIKKRQMLTKTIKNKIGGSTDPQKMYGQKQTNVDTNWFPLASELKKKRKVKPIRKLFQIYNSQLFQIAPCWLASPESVSKIFPLEKDLFDLVIVDEASQLAVERAIPFLYRARHAVVAGDEKQLPPFDLFQIKDDESNDDDEEISEEKSLLDLARTKYRTINLSWHYRSKYQDLINFSNHAFYEGLLNVVPNTFNDPQHPPIRWIRCDGSWNNQTNHVEADMVINEIKNIWKHNLNRGKFPSIGVITFNDKQQDLIKDIKDKKLESDPEFLELYTSASENIKKDDMLFVKNIENVQGDERDIIIFSIGYAKDSDGKFANFFGTLSKKGGENRLNVAVTRAREEMVIISSIDPTDIKNTSKHDGPKRLRQFLAYAKMTNSLNKEGQKTILSEINPDMERIRESNKIDFDSDFEIQVYKKLQKRGYEVETQIGFSGYKIDLAVVDPNNKNKYILGIECDGATFHSSKSVKERDVMRQKFLEGKGWVIERIWSRNWWKNPNHEIDKIVVIIDKLSIKNNLSKNNV